jgi:hypothetical protein
VTHLVAVVVKKSRVEQTNPSISHTHKVYGGVLNTSACHGRGYYTRRVVGQNTQQVLGTLKAIIKQNVIEVEHRR